MTTTTKTLTLKASFGNYAHTKALREGAVTPQGIVLDHIDVSPITAVFRRMARNVEFDIAEMAITTWLTAKAYDRPFTAIPVFPVREYWHGQLYINTKQATSAKDLEGKKVGVRAYTVTGGVWARGILAHEHGVDLDKITWVLADEEHVNEFHKDYPKNVIYQQGANLAEMLASGEIAGALSPGKVESPDVKQLIPDASAVEVQRHKEGWFPVNHTIVIKNELLQSEPWVAEAVFNAFKASKEAFIARIKAGQDLSDSDKNALVRAEINGGDPYPYGIDANRKMIETIIQYAHEQHILPRSMSPEEVFTPNAVNLK